MSYAIVCAAAVALLWAVIRKPHTSTRYIYDPHNPYRRWCVNCAQCQVQMGADDWGPGWWVTQGVICNSECECHREVRQ